MNSIEILRSDEQGSKTPRGHGVAIVAAEPLRKVLAFVEAYAASGNAPKLTKPLRALFEEMTREAE